MSSEDHKIQKFDGRRKDDYNLWRIRAEIALKGKGYWSLLQVKDCDSITKEKASAMIVNALGNSALRVCSNHVSEPMDMLATLDARYASTRATTRISVLTALYTKRYTGKSEMARYVDQFESLFSQLELMGKEHAVPESHKVGILLASMGTNSCLESSCAALRLQDCDSLSWESVTADLIQEFKQHNSSSSEEMRKPKGNAGKHAARKAGKKSSNTTSECDYCGEKGHTAPKCYLNPESEYCKLPAALKKKLMASKAKKDPEKCEQKEDNVHFGFSAKIRQKTQKLKAKKTNCVNREAPILDSGHRRTQNLLRSKIDFRRSLRPGRLQTAQTRAGQSRDHLQSGTVFPAVPQVPPQPFLQTDDSHSLHHLRRWLCR